MKLPIRSILAGCLTLALSGHALAQAAQERIIRFGHLNNADHPGLFFLQPV